MVDAVYIDNNRVQVIKNNDVSFDTDRPSVKLIESARIVHSGRLISFPSLLMKKAYFRQVSSGLTGCNQWTTLFWQEWGPGEGYWNERYYKVSGIQDRAGPTTRNLPRESLGSVPAETNYLDIRVKLTRTQTPPAFVEYMPPVTVFPENQWIALPGGSCPVEDYFQLMKRHFDIVREGNEVFLDRYQSVANANTLAAPFNNPQADLRNTSLVGNGWNSDSEGAIASDGSTDLLPYSNFYIATLADTKGFDASGTKRPGGTNACNGAYPDLTSNYSADIIITPGIYRAS